MTCTWGFSLTLNSLGRHEEHIGCIPRRVRLPPHLPLSGQSRKQTAVSHSTVEAEIVAADHAVRTSGLPALQLWETLLSRPLQLEVYQDNQATARIMSTGRVPTLRHCKRTHCVSVAWLHERFLGDDITLNDCMSDVMAADIFTKQFINKENGSMLAC